MHSLPIDITNLILIHHFVVVIEKEDYVVSVLMVLVSLLMIFNQCVDCSQSSSYGWLIFIAIQILPMTVIVLLILIFNIQLTNGSINGLVFFYQIMSIVYPGLTYNIILIPHNYQICIIIIIPL